MNGGESVAGSHGVDRLRRYGRLSWYTLGIAGLLALVGWVLAQLSLLLVPLVLALFPATLLVPIAAWLEERGVPDAVASLLAVVSGIVLIAAVIGLMVPLVSQELPRLLESAQQGAEELDRFLARAPLGVDGISGLTQRLADQAGSGNEDGGDQATDAAARVLEGITGFLLLLVILFFYLKDGARLSRAVVSTLPAQVRPVLEEMGERVWETVGPYFRGQLLVALVDAVFIGLGLVLLGVPLALPLAVLIFFGGMFPIVGAVTTGVLAVLVALADGGLTTGLIVAALVLAVQQLESNVLEPLILGHVIDLHPLVVLLSITAGAVLFGVLGAFLAVPVAAVVARTVDAARGDTGQPSRAGPAG